MEKDAAFIVMMLKTRVALFALCSNWGTVKRTDCTIPSFATSQVRGVVQILLEMMVTLTADYFHSGAKRLL